MPAEGEELVDIIGLRPGGVRRLDADDLFVEIERHPVLQIAGVRHGQGRSRTGWSSTKEQGLVFAVELFKQESGCLFLFQGITSRSS